MSFSEKTRGKFPFFGAAAEGRERAGFGFCAGGKGGRGRKKKPKKARPSGFCFLPAWKNGKSFRKQIEFWLEPEISDAIL